MNKCQKLVFVVGPTGSGKTALATALAKKYDGIIISCDSRQVYVELDVATNKEGDSMVRQGYPARKVEGIEQYLIDIVKAGERFTLHDWLREAKEIIAMASEWGKTVFVVGGTGLYATALAEGYLLPTDDAKIKRDLALLNKYELVKLAEKYDIGAGDITNQRRLLRTLEIKLQNLVKHKNNTDYKSLFLCTDIDRRKLYEKSDRRIEQIFDLMVDEINRLFDRGVSGEWLMSMGLDYRYGYLCARGSMDRATAIEKLKTASHNYIRRQLTWWRHHNNPVYIKDVDQAQKLVGEFLSS